MVVDFGASWCDHCRGMLPAVMGLTEKFAKHLFVLADVDSVPDTAADVRYTPTFSFYRRNRKVRLHTTTYPPAPGGLCAADGGNGIRRGRVQVDEVYGVNQQQLHDHIWLHEDSN